MRYKIGVLLFFVLTAVTGLAQNVSPATGDSDYFTKRAGQFAVVSDVKENAVALSENLSRMQTWICRRWTLPEKELSLECRVFSMSTQAGLTHDFRIDDPRIEIRKDEAGKDLYAMYVVAGDKPTDNLAFFTTIVILKDIERQHHVKFGNWVYRGVGTVDCSYARIREKIGTFRPRLIQDQPVFFTSSLLTMTGADWDKQPADLRELYDGESVILCLMLVKEFGKPKFVEFIGTGSSEQNLARVFGVKSYDALDVLFKKYLLRLSNSNSNSDFQLP